MARKKSRDEITITDARMFGSVMYNEKLCKQLVEAALGEPIDRVVLHGQEHDVVPRISGRGVRFDVYVRGSNEVAYDVEMQTVKKKGFERRLGYYRSTLDVDEQKRGIPYDAMCGVVVIVFTTFDPFKAGLRRYDCETVVRQTGARLRDGARIVVFNSKGHDGEVDPRIDAFLKYMEDDTIIDDDFVRDVDAEVRRLRANDDWYKMMTWDEMKENEIIVEATEKGLAAGLEKGMAEGRIAGLCAGVRALMANMSLALEQAMDMLAIPESDRPRVIEALEATDSVG